MKSKKQKRDADPYSTAMVNMVEALDYGLKHSSQMSEGEKEILENIKGYIIKNDPMLFGIIQPPSEK